MAEKKETKSRAWLGIVYPDSCADNWQELLALHGVSAFISPCHDKDLNVAAHSSAAAGDVSTVHDEKKAHYHVIMVWDGPTTYNNALSYFKLIKAASRIFPCATLRGAARYLIHLDNPEKYQYSREDVVTIGGLDYDAVINSASDDLLALCEIIDFIEDNDLISFRELVLICKTGHMDWFRVIMTSQRENVWKYLRSREYDLRLAENQRAVSLAQSEMLGLGDGGQQTDLQRAAAQLDEDRHPFGR